MKSFVKAAKILVLVNGFCLSLAAQQMDKPDSLDKHCHLKEIAVTASADSSNALLKFYKANKTTSTEDILARLPGVNMVRRGSYGMEPTIRGFSSSQINLTLDGMKIFGACTDHMDPPTSYIETSNLQSIQLANSEGGSMFGSSIGGSLNLKLAEAKLSSEKKLRGSVGSSYYSVSNSTNNVMQVNYGTPKMGIRLSGVYRNAGNYRAGNRTLIPFTQYEKFNLNLLSKFKLSQRSFLRADVITDDGWNIGYAALPMDVAFAKARIFSFTYKSYLKNGSSYWEAKLYKNKIKHSMDDTHRADVNMHMDMPGWSDTYGAYAETMFNLKKHHITLRTDGYKNTSRAEMTMYPENSSPMFMLTWPDVRRFVAGLYISDEWRAKDAVTLNFSTRIDYANFFINSESGREQVRVFNFNVDKPSEKVLTNFNSSLRFNLSRLFYSSISAGYSSRLPATNEMFGFYLFNSFDGFDYIGNPEAKSERALNAEVNVGYKSSKIDINASGFYNHIADYLIGETNSSLSVMTPGAKGVKQWSNLPYASLKGFELTLNALIHKRITLISNTRYVYGQDNSGKALPMMSPLKIISTARYSKSKYSIQWDNECSLAQKRINVDMNEMVTKGFMINNLRTSYIVKPGRNAVELNAGIENMFNRNYSEHLDWAKLLRPGRNFYAAFSAAF
ncbi:MAG: TonB-dependent receptor [Sphingobacteriaceae bacterium]|nr:TonB-dependent receptor [Sphingobacteriaceae bacterium]